MDHRPGKADHIRAALTCPSCDYSLRGLHGDVVICPECGHECNITAMMTRRWTGPWYHAPGFNRLLIPLCWLVILFFVGLVVVAFEQANGGNGSIALLTYTSILIGWFVLLWWVRDVPTEGRGLWLAMLAHGLFAGYMGGLGAIPWLLVGGFASTGLVRYTLWLLLVPAIAFLLLMRRGEKYIAKLCIRAWLNRPMER